MFGAYTKVKCICTTQEMLSLLSFQCDFPCKYYCKSYHTNNYTALQNKKVDGNEIPAVEETRIHLPISSHRPEHKSFGAASPGGLSGRDHDGH